MDQSYKIIQWWNSTLITILVIAVIGVFCYFAGYLSCKHKYERDISEIQSQVESLEQERESLLYKIDSLDASILSLVDSLSIQKEKIVYIKVTSYERVDSIRNLPLDSAVEFLARELSKEADSKR